MGRVSNFGGKIVRPECRVNEDIRCPVCGSRAIKMSRECGRVIGCQSEDCNGCSDYITATGYRQVFYCADAKCAHRFTVISSL